MIVRVGPGLPDESDRAEGMYEPHVESAGLPDEIERTFPPWIDIREAVPPYEVEVLTTDGTYCNVAERTRTTKHGEVFELAEEEGGERETVRVTYWMVLPLLPKGSV